jgi:protein SCO1/2
MTSRSSHILLVLSAFCAGLVVFLGVFLYVIGDFGGGGASPRSSAIGGPFKLTDQNGQPITDADLKGKPFLVFFGYTHCPDVCPTTLFDVSEVMRSLGKDADRTKALFITVDPDRDTPAVLKDYLSSFDPHLVGATGDQKTVDTVEKEYRVYAKKVPTGKDGDYSMDHSAIVYLMDKQGRFVAPFKLDRKPEQAAAELRKYL